MRGKDFLTKIPAHVDPGAYFPPCEVCGKPIGWGEGIVVLQRGRVTGRWHWRGVWAHPAWHFECIVVCGGQFS